MMVIPNRVRVVAVMSALALADGLLTLVRYAQLHLFREAWWRETGEWVGEEAGHAPPSGKEAAE